jgi:hypothetical protein
LEDEYVARALGVRRGGLEAERSRGELAEHEGEEEAVRR